MISTYIAEVINLTTASNQYLILILILSVNNPQAVVNSWLHQYFATQSTNF